MNNNLSDTLNTSNDKELVVFVSELTGEVFTPNLHDITADQIVTIINELYDMVAWYPLQNMKHANCKVGILKVDIDVDETWYMVFLKSYNTIVCGFVLGTDNYVIFSTGRYSTTTSKQVTFFCREFFDDLNSAFMNQLATFPRKAICTESGYGSEKIIVGLCKYDGVFDEREVHG